MQPGDQPGGRLFLGAVLVATAMGLVIGFWGDLRSALRHPGAAATQVGQTLAGDHVQDRSPPYSDPEPRPRPVEHRPEEPPAARGALTEVPNLSSEGMEVDLGPDGQVLVTSKYSVQRLSAGNPNDRRVLFSPRQYLAQFSGRQPQAMATAIVLPGKRYLLGGWHGEVLLHQSGSLLRVAGDAARPQGRIADMQRWRDRVLVAGDGLWELAPDGRRLREIPLRGLGRIRSMAHALGFVLLAAGTAIHVWDGSHARRWLDLSEDAGHVETVAPADDGGWWIGTTRGLHWTSVGAERTERVLTGIWTTAVVERPGELWVGSWKQGLLLRRGERWYRLGADEEDLPVDSVSAFAVDATDHAWLALYGGGAWHAPLGALRDQMLANPWSPRADP